MTAHSSASTRNTRFDGTPDCRSRKNSPLPTAPITKLSPFAVPSTRPRSWSGDKDCSIDCSGMM